MFSFLLILSSENTYPNEFEEGGTEIWCLPKNTLYYFKFNKNIEIILRKKLKRHLSPAITRQFVVFPSNALHQSLPIYNSGRFKLALKIVYGLRIIPPLFYLLIVIVVNVILFYIQLKSKLLDVFQRNIGLILLIPLN